MTEDGQVTYATHTTAPQKISGKIRSTSRVKYCTGRGEDTKRCKYEAGLETGAKKMNERKKVEKTKMR